MLGHCIASVSIVPVGLTRHRGGLKWPRPFDKTLALQTVRLVEHYGNKCMKTRGSRVFFCADELYMMADIELPPDEYYEEYPQLENGVGMMRLFITEFEKALCDNEKTLCDNEKALYENKLQPQNDSVNESFTIITGTLAFPYLTNLLKLAGKKYDTINGEVFAIKNSFFGESVTVSGLITGGDIIAQLKGKNLGSKLLIPQNMLKRGDDVFLDDVTLQELSETFGVPVRAVKLNGAELLREIAE